MVRLAALCLLLLLLPTSSFQNAAQETLGARPPPPRLLQELLGHQHPTRLEAQRSRQWTLVNLCFDLGSELRGVCSSTDPPVDMDPTRLGLFVAAATGTLALMAAVYCVYNRFYTRRRYLHGRLSEEPGRSPHRTFFIPNQPSSGSAGGRRLHLGEGRVT